jgi:hypothetical protein
MKKEFLDYTQALALKELGFDEPCFGFFYEDEEFELCPVKNNNLMGYTNAPLYQQAFRWFRENYGLKGHVEAVEYFDETPDAYHWSIFNKCNSGNDQLTYEEAELECIKKLIEIVKKIRI